ncbi:MAG: radical SAM protein [Proteobacteria bacterium]|nr:radical SAM protein [Pseudomonadota bacterium]MCP4917333.1 radical SAM protein [Pseudomonadota bacterium]
MTPPHLHGSYLVVELTNRCSLKCVHCSVSEGSAHPHHAVNGYIDTGMALDLFDDLVNVGARFDTLILFWLGEPLLHKDFGRIYRSAIRAAAKHGTFNQIEVHTNGTHLTPARTQIALNDGKVRQVWHFSLDAIGKETYLDVKGLDRFDAVRENIERFIHEKGRTGAIWPRPVFQFIVGENNVHEVGRFRAHWEGVCRKAGVPVRSVAQNVPHGEDAIVFFRQLDCPTAEEQARQNAIFRQAMQEQGLPVLREEKSTVEVVAENSAACSGFWKSPVVGWLGDVTTCTRDNLLHNAVGSLKAHRFSDLWWGGTMRGRRKAVAAGDYSGMPTCTTCFIPTSSNYTDLGDDEIAASAEYDRKVGA